MLELFTNIWVFAGIILFFGASIFIHELGHFLAARKRGLKVLRFSIGFGPKILSWEKDGIDYRISLLPFGGYVALPQLADMGRLEGGDGEDEILPKISFYDKFIVSVMGPIFNIIFAFFLASLLWFIGQEVPAFTKTNVIGVVAKEVTNSDGVKVPGPAHVAGLKAGDAVIQIDDSPVQEWFDINYKVVTGDELDNLENRLTYVKVLRTIDGTEKELNFEIKPVLRTDESIRDIGIFPSNRFLVGPFSPGFPAETSGLELGDELHLINGIPIHSERTLHGELGKNKGEAPLPLTVIRNGEEKTFLITPKAKEFGEGDQAKTFYLFGFALQPKMTIEHRNPIVQFEKMGTMIISTISALISPKSDIKIRNLSGPIGIMQQSYMHFQISPTWLLWFMTLINLNLAILNLMPIPVLDGGHIMFAALGKLRGAPLPARIVESSQAVFVVLLISMMLYVTFYDIQRITSLFQ